MQLLHINLILKVIKVILVWFVRMMKSWGESRDFSRRARVLEVNFCCRFFGVKLKWDWTIPWFLKRLQMILQKWLLLSSGLVLWNDFILLWASKWISVLYWSEWNEFDQISREEKLKTFIKYCVHIDILNIQTNKHYYKSRKTSGKQVRS